jgi:hypothetical protein
MGARGIQLSGSVISPDAVVYLTVRRPRHLDSWDRSDFTQTEIARHFPTSGREVALSDSDFSDCDLHPTA